MTNQLWDEKFKTGNYYRYVVQPFAKESYEFLLKNNLKTLLDLGCGQGQDSIYFAQQGLAVTSLDFSKQALSSFNHQNISKMHGDMRNLPFKENSFDCIYASFSMHFFKDEERKKIIKDVHRILKPDGFFFFIAKNLKDKYYGKGTEIEPNTFLHEDITRHFFTEQELTQF